MEEMKYNEKGFNKKLLLIPIVIIMGVIAVLGYKYIPSLPSTTKMIPATTQPATTIQQYTVTGNVVYDKDVKTSDTANLKAGRYNLAFSSNSDVTVLYGKQNFVICNNIPSKTGNCNFDVNSGGDGDYQLKVSGDSQTSHVTISQLLAF